VVAGEREESGLAVDDDFGGSIKRIGDDGLLFGQRLNRDAGESLLERKMGDGVGQRDISATSSGGTSPAKET